MLQPRKPYRELAGNMAMIYGIKWLWVMIALSLLRTLLPSAISSSAGSLPVLSVSVSLARLLPSVQEYLLAVPGLMVFMLLVFAPFVEEAAFRMLPLTLVKGKSKDIVRAVLVVICGIIFGIMHGSPMNIFIQGVAGLLLGILYLKNDNSQLTSYMSCVMVHSAYNFTVLMAAAM